MSLLTFDNVQIEYEGIQAVKDVSFSLQQGETLVIVGESGSGKTTLIKGAMGFLGCTGRLIGGEICVNGRNIAEISPKELNHLRSTEIGMVFQNCESAFCPVKTIGSAVWEFMNRHEKVSKSHAYDLAAEIMMKMGFQNPLAVLKKYPFELSGGMNQRIGIMFALLARPKLIIADEPTSALDVVTQKRVLDELLKLKEQTDTAILLVTHNIGVAKYMADRIGVMQGGKMVEMGTKEEIINHPKADYTKKLLGSIPRLERG